ncbi:hypothetical protein [Streptomyces sp. NPDC059783]|uniref:hypothetical protein n=1 Tax=Streptomyces sp. NPDC059783 TaxID=3346944 RepID=UPI00365877F5
MRPDRGPRALRRLAKAATAEEITALLDEAGAPHFRELSADGVVGWLGRVRWVE